MQNCLPIRNGYDVLIDRLVAFVANHLKLMHPVIVIVIVMGIHIGIPDEKMERLEEDLE